MEGEQILKQIHISNGDCSVMDAKLKLEYFQEAQVDIALDNLRKADTNTVFEWSLVQIGGKVGALTEVKETEVIMAYFKRAPCSHINVLALFDSLVKKK
jgi:hypothetical protein